MSKSIVLYLQVHQPYRVRHYSILDAGVNHNYFEAAYEDGTSNERILNKVAQKSYIPTNNRLLELINSHPEFKLTLSLTGTIMEQLQRWSPDALESFKALVQTGRVEILAETYHHSLAFFKSRNEFEAQVQMHADKVWEVFGVKPTAFRNTELAYNNDVAYWADNAGYKAVLAEGWDPVLGWRSPNFVYEPVNTENVKLLMKNYKLSDDIAFRFSNSDWEGYPLTASKFSSWLNDNKDADIFNLFMDYETFGEHQWDHTGIFDFLMNLPGQWVKYEGNGFMTVSEAADAYPAKDRIDCPHVTTWADSERDLSAWLGNSIQCAANDAIYELENLIISSDDLELINDWRRLTSSDHLYYMATKWFGDGEVHAYFSPYDSPYDAFISYMNAYHDLRYRIAEKGILV